MSANGLKIAVFGAGAMGTVLGALDKYFVTNIAYDGKTI